MAKQTVTLSPGESKQVSFEATPHEARVYQVSVDGLTGSFVTTVPLRLVPCPYCPATFTTEAELVTHMETFHPNMPYIISCWPQIQEVVGGYTVYFNFEVSIPSPEYVEPYNSYPFIGWYIRASIYDSDTDIIGLGGDLMSESGGWGNRYDEAGIWPSRAKVSTKYMSDPTLPGGGIKPVPPGVYELVTICSAKWRTSKTSAHVERVWLYAKTGAKVNVS